MHRDSCIDCLMCALIIQVRIQVTCRRHGMGVDAALDHLSHASRRRIAIVPL